MANFGEYRKKRGGGGDKEIVPRESFEISEPRCKACQSPNRREIDRYLVMGMSAAEVARHFSVRDGENYTRKSFSNHKNNHLNLRDAAVRRLVEKRAEESGQDIEETSENLLTERAILEGMVHKGWEKLQDGEMEMGPGDLMAALARLKDAEVEYYRTQLSVVEGEARAEMEAFVNAVKKHVPEQLLGRVVEEFNLSMQKLQGVPQIEESSESG
jgi:hypothetical protein